MYVPLCVQFIFRCYNLTASLCVQRVLIHQLMFVHYEHCLLRIAPFFTLGLYNLNIEREV